MAGTHHYALAVTWTGNRGSGTSSYRAYDRNHEITAAGKSVLPGSSDPAFRGDPTRWNPEEMLVASLSTCHMLGYLHAAAIAGVVVVDYSDSPLGTMREDADGGGEFERVLLRPTVVVQAADMVERAETLHAIAHDKCFIARSVSFPVDHEGVVRVAEPVASNLVHAPASRESDVQQAGR